jgi:L-seryl-tRNA(Ser) seleniumtransferase
MEARLGGEKTMSGIYAQLGISRVINAYEVVSLYGGSVMRPGVAQAMAAAAEGFYHIPSLNAAAGRRLAEMTHNQAAAVTCGSAASLALSAAASCHSGRDEIIVFRGQRNPYDQALTLCGAKLVEIGYPTHKAEKSLFEAAINEKTAAIVYFAGGIFERYALSIEDCGIIAKTRGIPLIVDGAAQVPPKENLWRYTQAGATVALFSGGKGIRGPQNSGLIVGDPELIDRISKISAPIQAFGRPMKTSKETVIGLLKAVELLLEEDYEAVYEAMRAGLDRLVAAVLSDADPVPDIFELPYILPSGRHGQPYPRAVFTLKSPRSGAREEFMEALMSGGSPSVLTGPLDENSRAFYVNPFGFQSQDEFSLVAERIREEARRWCNNE